jgi:RNA polymerase sigma-70 factor (ECF subfamily)
VNYAALSPDELVRVCLKTAEESAWVEFVRRFHPLIARVVLRVARQWGEASPLVIDDLIQETYLKLCADRFLVLQNFRSAHADAIFGYMKVFTANLVHDYFKAARSKKRGGAAVTRSVDGEETSFQFEPSMSSAATIERSVLLREVESCLKLVAQGADGARDRRIFWLYYRVGLPASEIAALPNIELNTKGVESVLLRMTRKIRDQLSARAREGPRVQPLSKGIPQDESL